MSLDVHLLHKCEQMCKRKHNELLRLIRQTDKVLTPTLTLCMIHPRNLEPQYYFKSVGQAIHQDPLLQCCLHSGKEINFSLNHLQDVFKQGQFTTTT
jgi:hypothetical protein